MFTSLTEAHFNIEFRRVYNNAVRPHSSLGYSTSEEFAAAWHAENDHDDAPEVALRPATGRTAARPRRTGQTDPRLTLTTGGKSGSGSADKLPAPE